MSKACVSLTTQCHIQALKVIYMVGTDEEVNLGIRGYFENNLSELDSTFIGRSAKLSSEDAIMVDRLCQSIDEDIETEIWMKRS